MIIKEILTWAHNFLLLELSSTCMTHLLCFHGDRRERERERERHDYLVMFVLVGYNLEPGGALNFFQLWVCGLDFRSVGLANWHLPLKRGACERKFSKFGGLWAENFKIWRLVSWKFPNLGACELKFGWKLRLLRLKFPNFFKRGVMNWLFCLKWDPCEQQERHEKGVFRAAHPHTTFLGQCPPPGIWSNYNTS